MPNLMNTLARLDRTKVFLGILAAGLVSMFLPGIVGAVLLYAIVGALAVLMTMTWSATPLFHRVARLTILAVLIVIATTKLS